MPIKSPLLKKNVKYVSYDKHRNNLGDILSPYLAAHFSDKKTKRISKLRSKTVEHYYMIGSILQRCNRNSIIWGSGFISADSVCREKPKKVLAVRGPLTRQKCLEQGIECPEIYGDPALLLPEVYPGRKDIKYDVGIIPHYNDKAEKWLKNDFIHSEKVLIIDVQNPDPLKVIDQILECKYILSSSLHGLILADAYKVPSLWIEFSQPLEGDGFKFHDYFQSVGRKVEEPVHTNEIKDLETIIEKIEPYTIDLDLEPLKSVFPF